MYSNTILLYPNKQLYDCHSKVNAVVLTKFDEVKTTVNNLIMNGIQTETLPLHNYMHDPCLIIVKTNFVIMIDNSPPIV